jgi:hypothetical protein
MKTLSNHVILYDKECPMCNLYTAGFVHTGMLDENGRLPYTEAATLIDLHHVNQEKACDEIALIDTTNGNVRYGVDSLTYIIGNRFSSLLPLLNNKFFKIIARGLYRFISFNRKVIIQGKDTDQSNACRPSFSLRYRMAYILVAWILSSFFLTRYALHLSPIIPATNFYREFLICGGQIIFQGILITIVNRRKFFDYLGNMMTVSLAGAILLMIILPMFAGTNNPHVFTLAFMVVVGLMFVEHIRRTRVLKLSLSMTVGWTLYRILVLTLILL